MLCRSSYILLFQLPGLAERLFLADDCEILRQVWESGPGALKTPGAFTDEDLERYGLQPLAQQLHLLGHTTKWHTWCHNVLTYAI